MTDSKPVTVKMTGSGKTYDVEIQPGDTPRDVLAKVIDGSSDEFILRAGTGRQFPDETNLFRNVDTGDELQSATNPVVGTRTHSSPQ